MNIYNNVALDNFIIDLIRILILLAAFRNRINFKLTSNRIKLYDYFLKFPVIMFDQNHIELNSKMNLEEFYAFFHWKPDIIKYRKTINHLIARDLIKRKIQDNESCYYITDKGIELIDSMQSKYKNTLYETALLIEKNISKMSDTKIEEEILRKSNIVKRLLEVNNENNI